MRTYSDSLMNGYKEYDNENVTGETVNDNTYNVTIQDDEYIKTCENAER